MPSFVTLKIGNLCADMRQTVTSNSIPWNSCSSLNDQHAIFDIDNNQIRIGANDCVSFKGLTTKTNNIWNIELCSESNAKFIYNKDSNTIKIKGYTSLCLDGTSGFLQLNTCNSAVPKQLFSERVDRNFVRGLELYQRGYPFFIRNKNGCISISSNNTIVIDNCKTSDKLQIFEYDPIRFQIKSIAIGKCVENF